MDRLLIATGFLFFMQCLDLCPDKRRYRF